MLNGVSPPVENNLYRRHRVRIKEVMANEGAEHLNKTVTVGGSARTTRNVNKGQLLSSMMVQLENLFNVFWMRKRLRDLTNAKILVEPAHRFK